MPNDATVYQEEILSINFRFYFSSRSVPWTNMTNRDSCGHLCNDISMKYITPEVRCHEPFRTQQQAVNARIPHINMHKYLGKRLHGLSGGETAWL